jgi:hypothetical protein
MNEQQAKEIVDRVIGQIFGFQNPLTLEQVQQKFAFDIRLPQQVFDYTNNQVTWAASTNPTKFISFENMQNFEQDHFMQAPQQINSIEDVIAAWGKVNAFATERTIDTQNVGQSDCVYFSENVWRSVDVSRSKNVVFSDGIQDGCEFIVASQRSQSSSFCMRLEDSSSCSNSFGVNWSNNVTNSFMIQDAKDLSDCMFCAHLSGKRFCIANMQYSEEEYKRIKDLVVRWILTN